MIQNVYNSAYGMPYFILSGTNTGYGFYGIHIATEKYLTATFLDADGRELKSDRYFNFSTSNGYSRLKGFATFLANYIADTEKMKKENSTNTEVQKIIQFRENYIEKVFKWLGQKEAASIPGCASYKVTLLTIVPTEIWSNQIKSKPELYVVKEKHFPIQ
jgi:tmRNA-binding protein